MYCEVTLPWDISDSSCDNENPLSLWINDCTLGDSKDDSSDIFRVLEMGVVIFFSTYSLEIWDEGEVEEGDEGESLLEWPVDLDLLSIHSLGPSF